jgi:aryl-alcohol dehydrogenase-like predicted oxidoreductase
MNYRRLGGTGLQVSEIGFGAWGIGGITGDSKAYGPTDDAISLRALRRAYELGVSFYDSAALYGYGHSEELIGAALSDVREHTVLASKVGYINFAGSADFSPGNIRRSAEDSLRRLRTDYIDLYQLHDPPVEQLRQDDGIQVVLEMLRAEGKIRFVGISARSPEESLELLGLIDPDVIQVNFNLADQRARTLGLLAECKRRDIGIIARTPLCFGFLTGKYRADDRYEPGDHRGQWRKDQLELWANAYRLFVEGMAEKEHQTGAQIALRFCLSFSEIATAIPGMLTPEHVEENTASSRFGALNFEAVERLVQIYDKNDFFLGR